MEKGIVVLNVNQYGLEPSRAKQIEEIFVPMTKMLYDFENSYNDVVELSKDGITPEVEQAAKKVRLSISKVRIETEKLRVKQKEEYLRGGKAVDGVANILKFAVVEKENSLKEIEETSARIEKEQIKALQADREADLEQYIDEIPAVNLASMPEGVWEKYRDGYKLDYDKRIEAEEQVEIERIEKEKADLAEQKRIKEENETLRKEAVERDRLQKIEDDKREKEAIAREQKESEEQAKRDAEVAERLRLQKIEDDKKNEVLIIEKGRREAAEKIIADKIEAERIEQEKIKDEEKSKSLAPDKEKLLSLASDILSLNIPIIKNKEASLILNEFKSKLEEIYKIFSDKIEKI